MLTTPQSAGMVTLFSLGCHWLVCDSREFAGGLQSERSRQRQSGLAHYFWRDALSKLFKQAGKSNFQANQPTAHKAEQYKSHQQKSPAIAHRAF